MYHYDYLTTGTCSKVISLDLEDDRVYNVSFMGGCHGNLQAIPILINGMTVSEIESKLAGIKCGARKTSCGDQLAIAVREAFNAKEAGIVQDVD